MIQFQAWPPPDWPEVVVKWDDILEGRCEKPKKIYNWCHRHRSTGRFHVHGWQSTEGFAFRFEEPKDAVLFALKWA